MADYPYDTEKTVAQSMISKFGRDVGIISITKTGTSYNPIISESTISVKALQRNYKANEIDGTLIQSTDKRFLIYSETPITTENKILDNNKKYSVVSIKETMPGPVNIIYEIQVRL